MQEVMSLDPIQEWIRMRAIPADSTLAGYILTSTGFHTNGRGAPSQVATSLLELERL